MHIKSRENTEEEQQEIEGEQYPSISLEEANSALKVLKLYVLQNSDLPERSMDCILDLNKTLLHHNTKRSMKKKQCLIYEFWK
jgi:hypothetical protein